MNKTLENDGRNGMSLKKIVSDEFLIRLAKQHLYIDERKKLLLPLAKQIAVFGKEIEEKALIAIDLTEERGDMAIGIPTLSILQDNYERLPEQLRRRVIEELFDIKGKRK